MPSVQPLLDAAGRRRSPATTPGARAGIAPRNKGQRYPADPPTVDEMVAVMRQAGHDREGGTDGGTPTSPTSRHATPTGQRESNRRSTEMTAWIEQRRHHRDRRAARSPGHCSSRLDRGTGLARRVVACPGERQSGVIAACRVDPSPALSPC